MTNIGLRFINQRRHRKRSKYFNQLRLAIRPDTTIICNNCFGARISQDLGYSYNSPIAGLKFSCSEDYEVFISHLKDCLCLPLSFKEKSRYERHNGGNYPIGVINLRGYEIEILFIHYKSQAEAEEKWYRRCQRVNFDDIIVLQTADSISEDQGPDVLFNLDYTSKVAYFSLRPPATKDARYCHINEIARYGTMAPYQEAHHLYKHLVNVDWMRKYNE